MFFNIVVLYVLVNVGLGAVIGLRNLLLDRPWSGGDVVTVKYGPQVLDKVYPGMARQERDVMLAEHYQPLIFSEFNHFRERPFAGKYVNVTEAGYRKSANQGPWPPAPENINVFVFGGSTTFGCGLPDDQTLPSCLQRALTERAKKRVCVYNFGVGFYYSTQERICLEKLLMDGYDPDAAFFIDGINEGTHLENRPTGSREMSQIFEQRLGTGQFPSSETPYWQSAADVLVYRLPFGRGVRYVAGRLTPQHEKPVTDQNWDGDPSARRVCETYFTNKLLIEQLCGRFGVSPIFIWQPSPAYKYDLKYHPFAPSASLPEPMRYHYRIMGDYYPKMSELAKQRAETNFVWCGDIQEDRTESLYCDRYHYTAAFSRELAEYICQLCLDRKLLDQSAAR